MLRHVVDLVQFNKSSEKRRFLMVNRVYLHEGVTVVYACRDFGLADIVHCSAMERFAANMPVVAGFELRGHSRYPNISRWYSAMDARPAYQKVKSDDTTLNLVIRYRLYLLKG